ncbi:hypothetical protein CASFOL_042904 [Castilleja foliolosa]|uniref:Uncharacterized protein n=1 Tax=Castilleja foliolosa TaxID=1961234 RepID=A0ABD3B794_9LAMI
MGYESAGSGARGCGGMLCWNNSRSHRRENVKRGTATGGSKSGRFSWFGECAKARHTDNTYII